MIIMDVGGGGLRLPLEDGGTTVYWKMDFPFQIGNVVITCFHRT